MRDNKGFSLVELIVVIAIMAILAAVAVVGYSVYIERAQEAADQQYLSDVVYRAELFAMENQIQLEQVVVAPLVDGPEDIMLIVGWDGQTPIYYKGDVSEIYEAVGNASLKGGLNNGLFDPSLPEIEIPEKNEGNNAHEHAIVTERVEPTCRTEGYERRSCECGFVEVDRLSCVDHNYPTEPNAVQGGFAYYVCDMCGKIIIESTSGQPIVPIG